MKREFKRVAVDLQLEQNKGVKMESNNQHGYFFRVTLKDEKVLRNNRQYKMLDTGKAAGVRFRNSALQQLNEEHLTCTEDYVKQQKNIANEIIAIAAGYADTSSQLCTVLATLDCITALASLAASAPIPYCRPKLLNKNSEIIKLKSCRHPCLELMDQISYIPNDCIMSQDNGLFHIITGPNLGGKSTFLRSVGCAILMAQMGSFVACDEAEISIVDSILARVGAGDCQMKGVSTFMNEMLETSTILSSSTKNSLILIDELGRGTSTYDGFGLAWAISKHIALNIQCFCLFATHFHELTALSSEVNSVKNYHVSATTIDNSLTLLYKVAQGPCDRSFGIHVARLAHFPKDVIDLAQKKVCHLEETIEEENDFSVEKFEQKRKVMKQEQERIIDNYLEKVAALDLNSLSDVELLQEISKSRTELSKEKNPLIKQIIRQNKL